MSLPSMILIASEQLWPNLHALIHWSREGQGLNAIHILHTSNEIASGLPARRLHALLQSAQGRAFHFQSLHPLQSVGTQPQEVALAVGAILEEHSQSDWIVVANGGLKTMTLGLLAAMASPKVIVAYSEMGAGWQRVVYQDRSVMTTPMRDVGAADMDFLPVEALVEAQHVADPSGIRLEIQKVQQLDTIAIARACMTSGGWDWSDGFKVCGQKVTGSGPLFERWCGSLLLDLGITNIVSGLKVRGDGTQDASESDLLCIYKGRFHYLELKLREESDEQGGTIGEIARKASSNCKTFGGASGTPHLILPNRSLHDHERNLLPLFHPKPMVLDARDSGCFISRLAELLSIPQVPRSLLDLENDICAWMEHHHLTRAFGREHKHLRSRSTITDPLFANVETFATSVRFERQQNWVLLMHDESITLVVEPTADQPLPAGWVKNGQHWKISKPRSSDLVKTLRSVFTEFINKTVDPATLVRAWKNVVSSTKSAVPPSQPLWKNQIVDATLSAEQKGKAARYLFSLDGKNHTVVIPKQMLPSSIPVNLRVVLRGFNEGLFQGEPTHTPP